MIYITNCCAI